MRARCALVLLIATGPGCSSDAVLGVLDDAGAGGSGGGSGAPDELPGWVPASGYWSEVSLNTLADVDPCPMRPCSYSGVVGQNGVLDHWTGGAFAADVGQLGTLSAWGGGGASGYFGNEVYAYDVALRTWRRLTDPVENPEITDPDNGELQNGTPAVWQHNDLLDYHPATSSLVFLGGTATLDGAQNGAGHMFDLATAAWRRTAALPVSADLGASAYDPAREIFWANTTRDGFFSFDPVGGPDPDGRHGVVVAHREFQMRVYAVADIEPRHDVYVLLDVNNGTLRGVDLGAPADPSVDLPQQGDGPTVAGGGFEWVPEHARFYWYSGTGNDIRTLTPPSIEDDWRSTPWTWAQVEVLGGPPPQPRETWTYGAWRWAPGIASFLICNGEDQPVHAFRP